MPTPHPSPPSPAELKRHLIAEARALGFTAVRVSRPQLAPSRQALEGWLVEGRHGDMTWLERHGEARADPGRLFPGTTCVISVSLPYLHHDLEAVIPLLHDPRRGYIARYALGRDYHREMRQRLQKLGERLSVHGGPFRFRAFSDSAPLFEVEIARQGGAGWRGKHTLLLQREGSFFFLGELCCDLPLEPDPPSEDHCGSCQRCLEVCPTGAITAPYRIDARRCIAYLTIEHQGSIPEPLRPLIGNRIYGCDDCQLFCPWNRFAAPTLSPAAFAPRNTLQDDALLSLIGWSEQDFEERLTGSAIRRLGHRRWLRNLAVALGNGQVTDAARSALARWANHPDAMVREQVNWALIRQSE